MADIKFLMLSIAGGVFWGVSASVGARDAAIESDSLINKPSIAAEAVRLAETPLPAERQDSYEKGLDAYIAGDLGKAKRNFEKAFEADPTNLWARNALRRINGETN